MLHSIDCPQCKATLDADSLRRSGVTTCPFCDAPLPLDALVAVVDDNPPHEDLGAGGVFEKTSVLAPLPPGSTIQIVESSAERHVLVIPPGKAAARSLGCFAIFWNGFMSVFTPVMLVDFVGGPARPNQLTIVALLLFLGLFWVVGLGLVWFWMQMRFTRYFVLLEPHRFVLQRTFFGRKKIEETDLDGDSRAELVEAYLQNDRPVHCVAVHGAQRTIKFGTSLSPQEKSWLRDAINRRLGREPLPEKTPAQSLAELVERNSEPASAISPYDAADSREIELLEQSPEKLSYSFPLFPPGRVRSIVSAILSGILALWWGFAGLLVIVSLTAAGGRNALPLTIPLFIAAPTIPLALIALVIARGRTTITVTREQLTCRRHVGFLGFNKKVDLGSIQKIQIVYLGRRPDKHTEKSHTGDPFSRFRWQSCIVATADPQPIVLTIGHSPETARLAGGLLRHQLQQWGYALRDE